MKALEVAASWAFFFLLGQGPVIIGFDGCFLLIYLQKSGFDYFWGTEVQEILYCELYPHMTEVTCFQTL